MKFSKTFITALAALPLATLAPTEAEAKPRCKLYTKTISGPHGSSLASAKVCRDNDDYWYFDRIRGSNAARAKLAEHIYYDLRKKRYGILVDYLDHVDRYYDRRYDHHYHSAKYDRYHHRPYYYAKKRKHYRKCDD